MSVPPPIAAATAGRPVRFEERERTILFGRGALAAAAELIGGPYTLLTTDRAAREPLLGTLLAAATARVEVPEGFVDAVAADLRGAVAEGTVVAVGGGRVIDVAKAIAAANGSQRVIAVPTTLSGAELTAFHRQIADLDPIPPQVRPAAVLIDPALSASAPPPQLAASSGNALGHAVSAVARGTASPFAAAVGAAAVGHLAAAWAGADPDRDHAALGALLAGWAVDQAGLSFHHVLAQTAVRLGGGRIGHAQANAALVPATAAAMRRRAPAAFAALDRTLDGPPGAAVEQLAATIRRRAEVTGIGPVGSDGALRERAVAAAAKRRKVLDRLPPAPDRSELLALYLAAAER